MANQVNIVSLNIDTQQLLARLSQTRQEIEQLQQSQRSLTQAGQTSSQQFIQQAAQLRTLQGQYNSQLNVVTQLNAANAQAQSATQAVNTALNANITSIAEATENNRQLIAVRNQLNLSTQEGQDALTLINQRLNENTEFIRQNVSAQEQQRMAIGDYSTQIQEALSNLNPFNGGIAGFTQRAQDAGGAGALLTQSFAAMRAGLIGATQAGIAFLATPIGAAIGLLAVAIGAVIGAFKFMTASMNSTEEGSQKLAVITGAVKGIFEGLWKIIKPLGEWLGKAFIAYIEGVGEALEWMTDKVADAMEFLGMDEAAEGLRDFKDEIKEASKASADLAKAEGDLDKAQRKSKLTQLEYQKQAERLRQQRDNESKSISERIALNNQLGEVLKKQLADELAIAEQALKVANLRIKAEGATKETLDAQAEALTEIADIQERITGQESEQLANLNSLRKEAADAEKERHEQVRAARQKAIDDAIQKNKDEIDLFIAQQGFKKKALQDELAFEEQLSKKRLALLEREYKAGKMSKEAYEAEKLNISNEFLKKQADAVVSEAQRELDNYKKALERKKADDTFFTEEKLAAKVQENNDLLAKEIEFQTLRRDQGIINEQEYLDAVDAVKEANRLRNEEAQKIRDEAKKEQEAINLELQRELDEEKFTNQFDLERERERIRYEAELAEVEKKGGDISKVKKKHALIDQKIEQEKESAIRGAYAQTFGNIAQLLGEKTAAGKASAIAQATINAYEGVSQVWASESVLPEPMATVSKLASTGVVLGNALGAVRKITGVPIPALADGGQIPTLEAGLIDNGSNIIPLSNGDDTLAYVKQGEVILNEQQQRRAGGPAFFRSLKVPGFNNGGLVGGNTNIIQQGMKMDMDLLAVKIGEQVGKANLNLPTPTVAIDTISEAQSTVTRIREGANL